MKIRILPNLTIPFDPERYIMDEGLRWSFTPKLPLPHATCSTYTTLSGIFRPPISNERTGRALRKPLILLNCKPSAKPLP